MQFFVGHGKHGWVCLQIVPVPKTLRFKKKKNGSTPFKILKFVKCYQIAKFNPVNQNKLQPAEHLITLM